jgi:hypothetical protein
MSTVPRGHRTVAADAEVGDDVHGLPDDAPGLRQCGPVAVVAVADRGVVIVGRGEAVGGGS